MQIIGKYSTKINFPFFAFVYLHELMSKTTQNHPQLSLIKSDCERVLRNERLYKGFLNFYDHEHLSLELATRGVLQKKSVLRNFIKFTGKHLCQRLFCSEVAGLRPATLLKKRLWHSCFPVNFAKFLRTPFLQSTSGSCFYILRKQFSCNYELLL